ncbi:fumarylacetoacetase [Fulvitalea axinellae]|uniref:fumarylacetoacetase n=1 Tax=Fulvitalea axinellae TaxID=1182444 RepID=A0AAU9CPH1_9BACT|nr:fumarylacetoacetase [Fulvitalea axinellae]
MENTFALKSWVPGADASGFPVQNLPFGVFRHEGDCRVAVRIGDYALDLLNLWRIGLLDGLGLKLSVLQNDFLNDLISLGDKKRKALRSRLQDLLSENADAIEREKTNRCLKPLSETEMKLPLNIGDYTDFYSSEHHARNVGTMFRGAENALMPNWKSLPVAYHGRSSSIIASGKPVSWPKGQICDSEGIPTIGESQRVDFELEMAFVIGKNSKQGNPVEMKKAGDHVFGFVLFNDWSARDIQRWEYVPLGPFAGKNFASSISHWITPLEALEPFRTAGPEQSPDPLEYLQKQSDWHFDVTLEVSVFTVDDHEEVICRTNSKHLYWDICQQLAHHTLGGCNVRVGDLMASGTISGPNKGEWGSMLEASWNGEQPIVFGNGEKRSFLKEGDVVCLRGFAEFKGVRIELGEVRNQLLARSEEAVATAERNILN